MIIFIAGVFNAQSTMVANAAADMALLLSSAVQRTAMGDTAAKHVSGTSVTNHIVGQQGVAKPPTTNSTAPLIPVLTQGAEMMRLWKVRLILGVLLFAIVGALTVAIVQTAKVFGFFQESSKLEAEASMLAKGESDPESLTRLLGSNPIRGFGSFLSSRSVATPRNNGKQSIIIE